MYKNQEELIEKINQLKCEKIDIDLISKQGYELSKQHTYSIRCANLLKEQNI